MLSLFTKIEAAANGCGAMETGDHYKNGVGPKNLKSKKNYGAALAFALLFLCSATHAQVGIAKTAKETLRPGERYELKIGSNDFSDFKIVTPKDGNLTLSLESYAEQTYFALYNEDGASLKPTIDIVSGKAFNDYSMASHYGFSENDNIQRCIWNKTVEKFKGNFTFKLDEGVYYFRIKRSQTGLSTVNVSIQFKDLNGNVIR